MVRTLFISRDERLLNPTEQTLDGFVSLSDLFDEVHIVILRVGLVPRHPVLRVANNVWLYTAAARFWWQTPLAARRLIRDELAFAGGLRADLIVARDPFESAVTALLIATEFERPTQLHVLEDYHSVMFLRAERGNWWRRLLARFTTPYFRSVRTATESLTTAIGKLFSIADLATLPRYHNYTSLLDAVTPLKSGSLFSQWSLVLLYKGSLGPGSTCYRVLDAVRDLLRNSRVGLVILGDGPALRECRRRALRLGILPQVVFETTPLYDDLVYVRRAHMLIVSDTDSDSDEVALWAAAAGIPLILARSALREGTFTHNQSVLFFRHDSVEELRHQISTLVSDVALRRRLVEEARAVIRERFVEDKEAYRLAYRASIEHALLLEEPLGTTV